VLNPAWSLEKIILSWKGFTARKINPLLGRKGNFWQRDYFDRLVRDTKHLANCVRYIRRNPQKRRLCEGEFVLYESEFARSIE
jgi:REP element-mobilizing transposase RayT